MVALSINGWRIPARDGTVTGGLLQLGGKKASWSNRPNRNLIGKAKSLSTTTAKLSPDDADTLEALLEGVGHHIPLNKSLSSTAGLIPQGGVGAFSFVPRTTSHPVYGSHYLSISSGSIIWNPGLIDGKWTVMYWRGVDAGRASAEHVVVRNGTKFWVNGVEDPTETAPEFLYSNGAVQFGVGNYDDIVLLPWAACDGFVEAFASATNNLGLFFYAPLDELTGATEVRDVVSGHTGAITNALLGVPAIVGTGARLFASGEDIDWGASGDFSLNTARSLTVEVAVKIATNGTERRILSHEDGTFTTGWRLMNESDGSVTFQAQHAGGLLSLNGAMPALNSTAHIVVVIDRDAAEASLYVNGALAAGPTSFTLPFDNDSADNLLFGNSPAGTDALDGFIDNVAMYNRALSAAEVVDRYANVSGGDRHGLGRPFSDLPYLDVGGDLVGGEVIEACGSSGDQSYLQHGASSGWVNNAREVPVSLDQRRLPERSMIAMDEHYVFDARYLDGGGDLYPVEGRVARTVGTGVTIDGRPGPWGFGQSALFDNTANANITIPESSVKRMIGHGSFSVAALIRRAAGAADKESILAFSLVTSGTKVNLEIRAANELAIGGRSEDGETFRELTGSTITDSEWHLVGGVLSPADGVIELYLDGVKDAENPSVTWNRSTFDGVTNTPNYIGRHPTVADYFNGEIAMVGWSHRRLSALDFRSMWEAVKRGWFR